MYVAFNDQTTEMNENYRRRLTEDQLSENTVKPGDVPLYAILESQRSKWQDMIESTDFTHSSRKVWKTINKLTKDYTAPQQQCSHCRPGGSPTTT